MKSKQTAITPLKRIFAQLLSFAFFFIFILFFAQLSSNSPASAQTVQTGTSLTDPNAGTAWDIRKNYFLRNKMAAVFGPSTDGGTDMIDETTKASLGPAVAVWGTVSAQAKQESYADASGGSGPVQMWPVQIPFLTGSVPSYRDTGIFQNLLTTTGYPVSDTQFQLIERLNQNLMIEEMSDPERSTWQATTQSSMQSGSAANSAAGMATNQGQSAITFQEKFLTNFTSQAGNRWLLIRDQLFIPIAILLLLPGAVLCQVKAIISQSSPVLGDMNPFEGIFRSIIAIVMIPGTLLVVNYGIDLDNSIHFTIGDEYTRLFGTNMYEDAQCAMWRAFPVNSQQSNANAIRPGADTSQAQVQAQGQGQSTFSSWEALNLDIRQYDPCAGLDKSLVANEQQNQSKLIARMAMNGFNVGLTMTWNILCAFQEAFLFYLFCMGPIAAALWVWPVKGLRSALPSWVEGVIILCFWSLFWNIVVLLMACFRGVSDTGTVIMTALNFLSTIVTQYAFDFVSLVTDGASSGVSSAINQQAQNASNAVGGGSAAGGGAPAAAAAAATAAATPTTTGGSSKSATGVLPASPIIPAAKTNQVTPALAEPPPGTLQDHNPPVSPPIPSPPPLPPTPPPPPHGGTNNSPALTDQQLAGMQHLATELGYYGAAVEGGQVFATDANGHIATDQNGHRVELASSEKGQWVPGVGAKDGIVMNANGELVAPNSSVPLSVSEHNGQVSWSAASAPELAYDPKTQTLHDGNYSAPMSAVSPELAAAIHSQQAPQLLAVAALGASEGLHNMQLSADGQHLVGTHIDGGPPVTVATEVGGQWAAGAGGVGEPVLSKQGEWTAPGSSVALMAHENANGSVSWSAQATPDVAYDAQTQSFQLHNQAVNQLGVLESAGQMHVQSDGHGGVEVVGQNGQPIATNDGQGWTTPHAQQIADQMGAGPVHLARDAQGHVEAVNASGQVVASYEGAAAGSTYGGWSPGNAGVQALDNQMHAGPMQLVHGANGSLEAKGQDGHVVASYDAAHQRWESANGAVVQDNQGNWVANNQYANSAQETHLQFNPSSGSSDTSQQGNWSVSNDPSVVLSNNGQNFSTTYGDAGGAAVSMSVDNMTQGLANYLQQDQSQVQGLQNLAQDQHLSGPIDFKQGTGGDIDAMVGNREIAYNNGQEWVARQDNRIVESNDGTWVTRDAYHTPEQTSNGYNWTPQSEPPMPGTPPTPEQVHNPSVPVVGDAAGGALLATAWGALQKQSRPQPQEVPQVVQNHEAPARQQSTQENHPNQQVHATPPVKNESSPSDGDLEGQAQDTAYDPKQNNSVKKKKKPVPGQSSPDAPYFPWEETNGNGG